MRYVGVSDISWYYGVVSDIFRTMGVYLIVSEDTGVDGYFLLGDTTSVSFQ